ncbi:MAG: hypothetical protein AB1749_00525 [Pseudomonadota bacterium]
MRLSHQELIYGGIAGAVVGILYRLISANWATPPETIGAADLGAAAAIGAIAGILAFLVRGATGGK